MCDPCYVIRSKNQKKILDKNEPEITWLNKDSFPAVMLDGEDSDGLLEKGIRGYHFDEEIFRDENFPEKEHISIERTSEMKLREVKAFEKDNDPLAKNPSELKARALTKGKISYKFDLATFVD
jgi:hypothetical protein